MTARLTLQFIALVVFLFGFTTAEAEEAPRNDAIPAAANALTQLTGENLAVERALDSKVSFDFHDKPLAEIADELSKAHRVNIVIDEKLLADAGVSPAVRMSLKVSGITLRSALNTLLRRIEVTYVHRNEFVLITTREKVDSETFAKAYNIVDIVKTDRGLNYGPLRDLIMNVRPTTWPEGTGPGPIEDIAGWFVIPQSLDVHREIEQLLTALRAAKRAVPLLSIEPIRVGSPAHLAAEQQISTALDKPAEFELAGTSLTEFGELLRSKYQLPIQFDDRKLEDDGIVASRAKVHANTRGVSLRSAIELALEPLGLTSVARDEQLWITTREEASNEIRIVLYPVSDLLEGDKSRRGQALIYSIRCNGGESCWGEWGGPGSVELFAPVGCLMVSQTDRVHAEITRFLADFRKAREVGVDSKAAGPEPPVPLAIAPLKVHRINAGMSAKDLEKTIPEVLKPEGWERAAGMASPGGMAGTGTGGSTPIASIHAVGQFLIVRQSPAMHERVEQLLRELGAVVQMPPVPTAEPPK